MIDAGILRQIMPRCPTPVMWVDPLNTAMTEFGVDQTNARIAAFLAQAAHESTELHNIVELWGPTPAQAGYEGRKDLGNTEPGDGFTFRGRGVLQITGRGNYQAASLAIYGDYRLLRTPALIEEATPACEVGAWFWQSHDLNNLADTGDFERITHVINGGLNGYDQRCMYWERAKVALGLT